MARWSVAIALMLLALASAPALGARQGDVTGRMEQARRRRAEMHKHFKQRHQHVKEDDKEQDDKDQRDLHSLANIKKRILEAAAFDAQVQKLHLQQKGHKTKGPFEQVDPNPNNAKFCQKKSYRKTTLKSIKEAPFIGLFSDLKNISRFEGSSITYCNRTGAYYVVYDSLRAIGKVGINFQFRGAENRLIPEDAGEAESQFEGLQYMWGPGTFLAVRESIDHETHGLVPLTEEIKMNEDETEWSLASVCPVKFYGLEDPNKGWEGIHYFERGGERYLLGLCESNYCKTIQGQDPPGLRRGNGRLVLTKYVAATANDTDTCHWETLKVIKLPESAYFLDYAGISYFPDPFGSEVAVVSQEDAAVWLGKFDWETMEFDHSVGQVYHFPRNDECHKVYCNVEGLTFLDQDRMLFASDRSKAVQPFECMGRDQSVHIMAFP